MPVGRARLLLLANAWARYAQERDAFTNVSQVTPSNTGIYSLAAFVEWDLAQGPYSLRVGGRAFVKDIELKDPELPVGLILGLGRRF